MCLKILNTANFRVISDYEIFASFSTTKYLKSKVTRSVRNFLRQQSINHIYNILYCRLLVLIQPAHYTHTQIEKIAIKFYHSFFTYCYLGPCRNRARLIFATSQQLWNTMYVLQLPYVCQQKILVLPPADNCMLSKTNIMFSIVCATIENVLHT